MIKAVLSLSYVLAQLGNYFLYLLMLYAAYEYKKPLTTTEELLLPLWTLLSGLGSPTAIVDGVIFIGRWLHLPAELTDLFLETWTVTRYGQVVLSVAGFGFATILVPLIYFGKARLRPHRAAVAAAMTVASFGIVVAGGTALRPLLLQPASSGLQALTIDPASREGARCHRDTTAGHGANRGVARRRSVAGSDPGERRPARRLQWQRPAIQLLERPWRPRRLRYFLRLRTGA